MARDGNAAFGGLRRSYAPPGPGHIRSRVVDQSDRDHDAAMLPSIRPLSLTSAERPARRLARLRSLTGHDPPLSHASSDCGYLPFYRDCTAGGVEPRSRAPLAYAPTLSRPTRARFSCWVILEDVALGPLQPPATRLIDPSCRRSPSSSIDFARSHRRPLSFRLHEPGALAARRLK